MQVKCCKNLCIELKKCEAPAHVAILLTLYFGRMTTLCFVDIGTTNNLLAGELVHQNSPNDAMFMCTFLCEFNGSAHCQVQYGTDQTYMNLPYSAKSTEPGTVGHSVGIVLREQLNSSTTYYYNVSAISGYITVMVQGAFTTPQFSKYLHV